MDKLNILKLFSFFILCTNFVAGSICKTDDEECTKNRAKEAYFLFVNGIDSLVDSSDPITMNLIKASLPTIKYELRNAKLTGLKTCDVTLMSVYKTNSTFKFYLHCPTLELNADYSMLGTVDDMFVEGEDKFTIKIDDYLLKFNGIYEKMIGTDEKEHIHIKNYYLEVEPRGNVVFNFRNLFNGDQEKTAVINGYLNKNWKEMDKALRAPALYTLMDTFVENLNNFLAVLPIDQIFPELTMN